MRKSAVQISLFDIYNGVSESIEQKKPELVRLLEEHIDFDSLISAQFRWNFYSRVGRPHKYHLVSGIVNNGSVASTRIIKITHSQPSTGALRVRG